VRRAFFLTNTTDVSKNHYARRHAHLRKSEMVVESRSVAGRSEQEKKVILRAVLRVAQHELTG